MKHYFRRNVGLRSIHYFSTRCWVVWAQCIKLIIIIFSIINWKDFLNIKMVTALNFRVSLVGICEAMFDQCSLSVLTQRNCTSKLLLNLEF